MKFCGFLGVLLQMKGSTKVTYTVYNPLYCFKAMLCHWTQMVWYRWLFIAFSRYTYAVDVEWVRVK